MRIRNFEDIKAWQEARLLTNDIYRLTKLPDFKRDWSLLRQVQAAAVSVMNNIAEGFDSGTKLEFIRFLGYARRSASEVQCNLYVALDQDYIKQQDFDRLYEQAEKIRRMITAFINYLKELAGLRANA